MAINRAAQQAAQAATPRQDQRQGLEPPSGVGVRAVGVIQPAAGHSAARLAVHERHHAPQALLARIEIHVGVHQQHVARGRGVENAVQIGRVRQAALVAKNLRFGEVVAPR